MFDRLIGEIRGFTQHPNESLVEASLSFHGHGLGRVTIIQIFYHVLDDATQAILDSASNKKCRKCEMDATNVEDLTPSSDIEENGWEDLKKKLTISTNDIEEEDIEKTTTVGIPEIGATVNHEMKTVIHNPVRTTVILHKLQKRNSRKPILKKPCANSWLLKNISLISKPMMNKDKRITKLRFKILKPSLVEFSTNVLPNRSVKQEKKRRKEVYLD
ncbi:hypothetical protein Tco_0514015 [Tanacetum coccineum]